MLMIGLIDTGQYHVRVTAGRTDMRTAIRQRDKFNDIIKIDLKEIEHGVQNRFKPAKDTVKVQDAVQTVIY